jgi:uncharacterized protein YbcI
MSVDTPGEQEQRGQTLLGRISGEMVQAQKEFFGKGPTQAKSYMLDDLLIIVMRGGLTTAEQTMLQFGQADLVRQFRQLFENEMTARLTGMVEELTGRKVATYQSQVMFHPHVVVEMFVFEDGADDDARAATAQGQLHDDDTGSVMDRGALGDAKDAEG